MSEALVILALVLLNGFFALSELALVSAKRARLQVRADQGSRGARVALALLDNPTALLSSTQIGISFDWRGLRVEVLDMDGPRIDKLLFTVQPHAEDPSG